MKETKIRTPKNRRKAGFNIFPIQVRMPDGFNEKTNTITKNKKEKIPNAMEVISFEIRGATPTWKETVAVLGIANSGPMVRYNAQVKKYANPLPTLLLIWNNPLLSEMPIEAMPKSGSPTPVIQNPIAAKMV